VSWSLDLARLLDPNHWFDSNPPPPSGYYQLLFLISALTLIGLGYFYYFYLPRRWRASGLAKRLASRAITLTSPALLAICVLVIIRDLQLPPLSARWLIYACLLYLVGVGGYFLWYYLARYPADRQAQERRKEYNRFLYTSRRSARR
jgi:drug/metabolite transporter (DMT)-like permease